MGDPEVWELGFGLALVAVGFVLVLLAKMVLDLLTPFSIDRELVERRNPAAAVGLVGYFVAILIVLVGALDGPSRGILEDSIALAGYGALGIVLLNASRWINDRFILSAFSNADEIIHKQNLGAAAVEFGSYVASGLVVAGAIHGEGGGFVSALAFFGLGQLALVLFARVYDWITPFDVHAEVERGNTAAGISFGGTLVALGVLLMNGNSGSFVSWSYDIAGFALYSVAGFLLLPVVRLAFDRVLLPKADLNREIAEHENWGVGLLEMAIAIAVSVLFVVSVDLEPLLQALLGAAGATGG